MFSSKSPSTKKAPLYVELTGRYPGLTASILNAMGLNATTLLEVFEDRIHFEQCSLAGRSSETIPIKNLGNIGIGYTKSLLFLVMGLLCVLPFLLGILFFHFRGWQIPPKIGIILLVISLGGLIFLLLYFASKKMVLFFISSSGHGFSLSIAKKLTEGKDFSEKDMERVVNIVMGLVKAAK